MIIETNRYVIQSEEDGLVGRERPHTVLKEDSTVLVQSILGDIDLAVSQAFDCIGAASIIGPGDPVAIKINLGGGIHHVLTTYSDPAICAAIIRKVRQLGGQPFVCEADMRAHLMDERMLRVRGYAAMLKQTGVPFVNLSRGETVRMHCRDLDIPLILPEILLRPETRIISFAPPKHHWECGITASQKNMYGAIAEWRKSMYHRRYARIDEAVAAASRIMSPDISVVASFDLGAGMGPHFCYPVPFNRMIVARDMVRADKAASEILGYPFDKVRYALLNTGGINPTYDLHPNSCWPDDATLARIRESSLTPPSVRLWKRLLFPQYFVPHHVQITLYPPLEFIVTEINRRLFRARLVRHEPP